MISPDTLRLHRTLAGLSQRALARAAGISPIGIKRIEDGADAGRLPLAVVKRIADAIDLTIDQLLEEPAAGGSRDALAEPTPLNHQQAKLLRRLQRGEDITRRLSRPERELTIPAMIRHGSLDVGPRGFALSGRTMRSLSGLAFPGEPRK